MEFLDPQVGKRIFFYLKKFLEREGHCRVAQRYKADDDYRLGVWVAGQRNSKDTMGPARRQRLEALPGWSWDVWSDDWEEGFSCLKKFAELEGHSRVAQSYKTDDDYRLGVWVAVQRRVKDTMDPARRQRLEALPGWSWNSLSDKWEEGFSYLKKFSEREGHCRVAQRYKADDDYRLGVWVAVQRADKDTMSPDRRQRLEALPGWSWNARSDKWEEGFAYLKKFAEGEGHCRLVGDYKTDDDYRLGQWVAVQRAVQDTMNPDRRQRLEALPRWSWDAWSDKWEEGFSYLKKFAEREGHCRVVGDYKTDDDYRLGQWVGVQRTVQNTMSAARRQRLEALPRWSWDALSDDWEEGFSYLKEFAEREGHSRVAQSYKTDDDYRLGVWVTVQRRAKDTMNPDRRQRLEALPGWSWNTVSDRWEKGFSYLKEFAEREGHCRVSQLYKTADDYRLGQWVAVQRRFKDTMKPDHRQRLEALAGWLWKVEK
jgi:hypothetical protein